ncbi:CopG family transcriptional regulator [Scytonema hofmannii PCC 7110]|uniref:CopG family transcriptional regulator n=1 Tax=Scytonema hofmannii PCC 7110 TaxID=128403 RepID=A0A139XFE3_9CYAN|nr:DUF411 domain-containing protein [Scytonema hofmannii]KYC43383.1 CopG family transcriptional regulator [Scytonema hofmannii PCC 7110]
MQKRLSSWIRKSLRIVILSIITTGFAVIACATVAVADTKPYSGTQEITVYRSPSCGCCGAWVEHMQKHGFQIKDIKTDQIEAIKQKYNLPQELASCHTAIIDGYVMEGHIPANDIKRFLQQKSNLAGLAVPGMPVGTPGMELGNKKQPFAVVAFDNKGEVKIFQEYQSY